MKKSTILLFIAIICVIQPLLFSGCSSRHSTPVIDSDSTTVFMPKHDSDLIARILLCRKISKKSGRLIDLDTEFNLGEKESVKAIVKLENRHSYGDQELIIHFDWIDQDGNSFFLKQIFLTPEDTASTIFSSISLSPENRQPGEYMFRVFFFRELIAEKKFRVLPVDTVPKTDGLSADITLCKKMDKKSGKMVDVDSVFEIKENGRITAVVDIRNRKIDPDRELILDLNWMGPDGKSFYSKEIDFNPTDTASVISSSISIETRLPEQYKVKLSMEGISIAEKEFSLIPEVKAIKPIVPSVTAQIILSKGVDKKTGQPVHIDSVFNINKKGKIHAFAKLPNRHKYLNQELKLRLDWIGPDGKSFYKKQVDIPANDTTSVINSAISISPETRQPGNYQVRISLSKKTIGVKKFKLIQ